MVYSTRLFVVCLTLYYFVLVFFSPFSIAITSLGEERAKFSVFRTFVGFALVWFCLFPLPLGVCEGLRFVIVALLGLFSSFTISVIVCFLHVCPGEIFILDSRLANFGKETHLFVFLLVVF